MDNTLRLIQPTPLAASLAPGIPEELGVRRRIVRRFPYAVFYLELPDAIRILAIAHSRRRPFYWRDRLQGG